MEDDDFDTILAHIGMGKWNLIYYLIVFYWRIALPHHALAGAFFSPYVNHTCRLPGHTPEASIAALNATTNILSHDACTYLREDTTTGRLEEVPCTEWDYDNSTFSSTVTSEFDLVCGRQYLRATYQSIYMAGFLVGALLSGYLAYQYGRFKVIVISSFAYSAMALGSAWLPSLGSLLVFRFLLGTMHPTSLTTGFVLVMEVTEVKWRTTMALVTGINWGLGTTVLGAVAYAVRDWRWLQTYVSLFGPVMLPFLFLMDESPRWLMVTGRHQEALKVLRRAARMNKKTLPPTDRLLAIMKKVQEQSASCKDEATHKSMTNGLLSMMKQVAMMFSTKNLVIVSVVTSIAFFAVSMIFFGLTLAASSLGIDDPFTFVMIAGVVELPSLLGIIIMEKIGRKYYAIFLFGVCAIALLLQPLVSADMQWLSITLVMTGKMASASAFDLMYLYSSELYPTEVRTQGMSVGLMSSRVGAFIAPFIMSALAPRNPWAIPVVFGLVAAVAAVSFLLVWETVNVCLPDTIAQLEEQRRGNKHTRRSYELVMIDEKGT